MQESHLTLLSAFGPQRPAILCRRLLLQSGFHRRASSLRIEFAHLRSSLEEIYQWGHVGKFLRLTPRFEPATCHQLLASLFSPRFEVHGINTD
jgi:hypothetical protein